MWICGAWVYLAGQSTVAMNISLIYASSPVLIPFAAWELCQASTPALGPQAWWLMLVVALLPGVGAYWIYGWTQKILGASRVAMTLYLGPLYTAVVAWLLLGEPMGWHHLAGGVFILSGVGLVMSVRKP
jgi:drug/metabolite transporter (DMT)-like permease